MLGLITPKPELLADKLNRLHLLTFPSLENRYFSRPQAANGEKSQLGLEFQACIHFFPPADTFSLLSI